jgi:hypothetical protein
MYMILQRDHLHAKFLLSQMFTKTEAALNVHKEIIRGSNGQITSDAIERISFNWLGTELKFFFWGGRGCIGACTCAFLVGGS